MTAERTAFAIRWCRVCIAVTLVCSVVTLLVRIPGKRDASGAVMAPGPAMGMVADLTWGISRADIDRTVADMRSAGVTWVRANQNWAAVEADGKGILNQGWLAEVDYAVTRAQAAGIQVLMPLSDGVPYWASADPNKFIDAAGVKRWNKLWRPTNPADYAAFATSTVNRYKAMGVRTYEIWNEQNSPYFWPSGPNAADYTALLKAAYPAIKAADPTATVILGGLSKSDYLYLDKLYAAGAAPYFDAVNIHPYTGSVDPAWCWNQAGTTRFAIDAFCGIEEVRRSMVANGDTAKSIWLTEFGWSTTTSTYGVSEAVQATFLTDSLTKVRTSYPYVSHAFWYNFRNTFYYNDDPAEIEANWGLAKTDFSPKPALAAYKAFAASVVPPRLSISDATVVEGGQGTATSATFTLSLSAPAPQTGVTLTAATANGSAAAGSDYTALAPTTVSFAPGGTTGTVTVPVVGDSAPEGNETFVLNLSAPVGATLADAQGLATIVDPLGGPSVSITDASVQEGPPGTTSSASFTLSLSAPTNRTVTVKAATANATALAGLDYTAVSTTVSFAPGERTRTLTVPIVGDVTAEAPETFVVNLSAAVGAVVADLQGVGTIFDGVGVPAVSINDVAVVGGATAATATFTVSLAAAASSTVSVQAATANGSAVAGADYTALAPATVSFAPGERTKSVSVAVLGDVVAEPNETFAVNLSAPVGGVLADTQGIATILDPAGAPTISINDASLVEGAAGSTSNLTLSVTLSAPTDQTVIVKAATANGTALAGSDYTAVTPTSVIFPPGQTSRTVTVPVLGDSTTEPNETFVVTLSAPVGAVLADSEGLATIIDPGGGLLGLLPGTPPPPALAVSNATVVAGAPGTTANVTFTVTLSQPAPLLGVSVQAATANGTAAAGTDYTALAPTTVTFGLGQTVKTLTVPVLGDAVAEDDETFTLNLSSPTGAVLGDPQGLGTIVDRLGAPTLSISDTSITEGAGGTTTNATFTLSLSAPSDRTVSLKASTTNGSATAGSDYTALPLTTVSFAPGQTTRTLTVPVQGDAVAEPTETFVVNLSSPVGAAFADGRGIGTIFDPLGTPAISINDVTVLSGPTSTSAAFTVSLAAPASSTVTVRAATANGTATAGSDYTALGATTVSFAPGETTRTVAVPVLADVVNEPDETFVVNLSSAVGAGLADAQGLATILDPLGPPTISVGDISLVEGAAGTTSSASFTVTMSAPTDQTVTVAAATANGTALAGSDYTAVPLTTLSFAPGERTKTIPVNVAGDSTAETNETFVVNLSSPVIAVLADSQGVATIIDSG